MAVTQCVCFDVTFERCLRIAEDSGQGLLGAHNATGCGARCGICIPYLTVVLKTGETDLPIMWTDDFRAHGVHPGPIAQLERRLAAQAPSTAQKEAAG